MILPLWRIRSGGGMHRHSRRFTIFRYVGLFHGSLWEQMAMLDRLRILLAILGLAAFGNVCSDADAQNLQAVSVIAFPGEGYSLTLLDALGVTVHEHAGAARFADPHTIV